MNGSGRNSRGRQEEDEDGDEDTSHMLGISNSVSILPNPTLATENVCQDKRGKIIGPAQSLANFG